jgi:hypothetical protein
MCPKILRNRVKAFGIVAGMASRRVTETTQQASDSTSMMAVVYTRRIQVSRARCAAPLLIDHHLLELCNGQAVLPLEISQVVASAYLR